MKRALSTMAGLLIVSAAWSARAVEAQTIQELILRSKPAVVLVTARVEAEVTLDCGAGLVTVKPPAYQQTGTAWFIEGRGYLITNAHVVDPAHRRPSWVAHELKKSAVDQACVDPALARRGLVRGQEPDLEDEIRRRVDLRRVEPRLVPQITVALSNGKMFPAEVVKFSPPLLLDASGQPASDSGRDLALLRVEEGSYPALEPARRHVEIGDPVHILGFPGVVLSHELLRRTAAPQPSVTTGTVSGFNQDAIGQDVIQTDAPAAYGNSGGPAIGHTGPVVGVLTFVSASRASGTLVQGFNFLIPAGDVLKFLEGTVVSRPGESRFSEVWVVGLRHLFTGRFQAAAARFREANALLADLPDVQNALTEAETRMKEPRPFPWAWATLGIALASMAGYGTIWYRRWQRNRFRIQTAEVVRMLEKGLHPLLLDVRKEAVARASPFRIPGAIYISPEALERGELGVEVDPERPVVAYCS